MIAVFGLLGHRILNYLHRSVPALMIAGGLLLLLIALDLDGVVVLVTRLAGMVLSAITVQQIINGVTQVIRAS